MKNSLRQLKNTIAHHDALLALTIAIITILTVIFLGTSNNGVIPAYPKAHYHYTQEPHNSLSFLSDWDGPDYLHIARYGYQYNIFYANFFPLYPLAVHTVHVIIPSYLISGLLVSWFCLFGALYFYIKIVRLLFDVRSPDEKVRAVLPFLLFPSGVFLVATYSESLTALCALAAIYYTLRKRHVVAAILLLLCTASHITGIFAVVLIGLLLREQHQRLRTIALTVPAGCLGLVAYMVYCLRMLHDPLAFINSQKSQHGWLQHSYLSLITRADPLNVVLIVLLIVSALYWWQRRKSFAVYSLLFLIIPLLGRQYGGFNRYVLLAFPLQFMVYDYFRHKTQAYTYVVMVLTIGWVYFTLQYAAGYIGN